MEIQSAFPRKLAGKAISTVTSDMLLAYIYWVTLGKNGVAVVIFEEIPEWAL